MLRVAGLALLVLTFFSSNAAASSHEPLSREHKGIKLIALPAKPGKTFDTTLLPADKALKNLSLALDSLLEQSPFSAQKLAELKLNGEVVLVYLPDDAPKGAGGEENVAVFLPDFLNQSGNPRRDKTYLVVVGRHGIKWPTDELAAVLAHELVGHGMQHKRGRIGKLRTLDLECEAYLYEERVNQDLNLSKHTREMITFRKAMEEHWCADLKLYQRANQPKTLALWDVLNPDVDKLLKIYDAYLDHSARSGATKSAVAAAKQQTKEKRDQRLKDATADELFSYGMKLLKGDIGFTQDAAEAVRLFNLSADKGEVKAQIQLGNMHKNGEVVPKDLKQAASWYEKAAEQGHADAQNLMGSWHENGVGVAKNGARAADWYRRAAEQGHVDAQASLAAMLSKGQGVKKDRAEAARWYRKAAEQGHGHAQLRMGWLHLKGRDLKKDYAAAERWFEKAAAQNNPRAFYYLATMSRLGLGRDKDHARAARLYREAAEYGHTESQYRLGWYLYRGIGLQKDYKESALWVSRAAETGHAKSQHSLGWMHTKGNGVRKDLKIATAWFRKAAEQGYPDSQARLGWLHLKGTGAPKDMIEAYLWYSLVTTNEMAGKKGRENARKHRDRIAKTLTPDQLDEALQRLKRQTALIENAGN